MKVDRKEIRAKAEELCRSAHIPSVSMTVLQDGIAESVVVGEKDIDQHIPADVDTVYSIGSCTKSFTAAAIGVLCDRGQLELDAPVRRYMPEFEMYDPYVGEHLTVRDTLCHRCGLPRHELAWYPRLLSYGEKDIFRMLRALRPNEPFRYKMQYQNIMFTLAGMLIERVSGMSWRDFVEENLIQPLGIGRVTYDAPELLQHPARAKGYCWFDGADAGLREMPYSRLGVMCAAGSMSMTSRQLAKWDAMFLNKGRSEDGAQVLSEKMVQEMTSPQMIISDPIIPPMQDVQDMCAYGLGFFLETYRGVKVIHHGGYIDGFIADQCFVPDRNFACTVLTNAECQIGARTMRYLMLDQLLDAEPTDWIGRFETYQAELKKAQQDARTDEEKRAAVSAAHPCPVALEEIEGRYDNEGYGDICVAAENGGLTVQLGTISLSGKHYRDQYFLFEEPRIMPGEEILGSVDVDREGRVTGFALALEKTDPKPVLFEKNKNKNR